MIGRPGGLHRVRAYGRLCTEFYDLDKPDAPAAALAWYRERARAAGGAVLEPMCGSGRYLLPLLAAGIDAEGTDASADMLAACRRHAARLGLAPVLHHQPLESLTIARRFALAFVPDGSIGLVPRGAALDAALARLRAQLEPGGTLLVGIDQPGVEPWSAGDAAPREVQAPDGTSIRYVCRAEHAAGGAMRYDGRYERRRGGQVLETEHETIVVERHAPDALVARLAAAGFVDARIVPDASWTRDELVIEGRAPAG